MVFIIVGSRNLGDFDWALTTYAVGSIFAAFAVVYRYAVWAQRPPTRMYLRRGIQAFFLRKRGWTSVPRNTGTLFKLLLDNFVLQRFITRRSSERWIMHACLSWGGMLAFALTFPLVFGWMHFESLPDNAEIYRCVRSRLSGGAISRSQPERFPALQSVNIFRGRSARRTGALREASHERQGRIRDTDFRRRCLPGPLLFAVCVTGLMLTVSAKFLAGSGFQFIGMAHAASVIGLLLYLPFGKLFPHYSSDPCRSASPSTSRRALEGPAAHCLRCGEGYASQMHVDDLKIVLDQLGFNFRFAHAGRRTPLPGYLSAMPAAAARPESGKVLWGDNSWRYPHSTKQTDRPATAPHLNYEPSGGWNGQPDCTLVKTHCCFCGVQCGIQLKVHDNKVVGFEPWEEFPVNHGMLCPKGVKRYLQNEHPDRLLVAADPHGTTVFAKPPGMKRWIAPSRPSARSRRSTAAMRSPCWAAPR